MQDYPDSIPGSTIDGFPKADHEGLMSFNRPAGFEPSNSASVPAVIEEVFDKIQPRVMETLKVMEAKLTERIEKYRNLLQTIGGERGITEPESLRTLVTDHMHWALQEWMPSDFFTEYYCHEFPERLVCVELKKFLRVKFGGESERVVMDFASAAEQVGMQHEYQALLYDTEALLDLEWYRVLGVDRKEIRDYDDVDDHDYEEADGDNSDDGDDDDSDNDDDDDDDVDDDDGEDISDSPDDGVREGGLGEVEMIDVD